MRVLLLLLLVIALLPGGCVVVPRHGPFSVFPFGLPFGLFGIALYVLPTIIAVARGKRNILGIVLVNILLGWTFVGWIVALVWACIVKN